MILLALLVEEPHRKKFEDLYLFYKHRVYNYAYRTVGDVGFAENVVQETFVILGKYMGGIQKIECKQTGALVRLVAQNTANSYMIKQNKDKKRDMIYKEDLFDSLHSNPVQEIVEEWETNDFMIEITNHLPKIYRDVILLRYMGYPHSIIGRILDIGTTTSRKRYERAKEKLQSIVWGMNNE